MKTILFGLMGVMLISGAALAVQAQAKTGNLALSGIVVDNACASGHKTDMAEFVKTHTKDCALMPNCEASGYSLYTPDGQLLGFTKSSNTKIARFLKGKKNTLKVEIKAKKTGNELELISIKNQV